MLVITNIYNYNIVNKNKRDNTKSHIMNLSQ